MYTNSEICTYRECPRKHELKYLQCVKPVKVTPALDFGTRWHKLLESLYRMDVLNPDDDLVPYFKGYKVIKGQVLWVEKEFRARINEFDIGGKIDLVVRIDGQIWIVEHKTTAADISGGSLYAQAMQRSAQLTTYRLLLPEAVGCIVDVVRKGKTPKFAQFEIHHTQRELEDARETLLAWCRKLSCGVSFPKNPDSCYRWGTACEYMPICMGECDANDVRFRIGRRHEELENDA